MIRAVLAVMAGIFCAFAGIRHASALNQDASRLRRWVQILQHLSLLLRQGLLSIPDVLLTCADSATEADRLLREMVQHLQSDPLLTLAQAFCRISASGPEQSLLLRMFTNLGHGMLENRCRAVEQAAEEMKLFAQAAEQKAEKDVKLWQRLGIIGGLCLTLLLL